MSTGITVRSCDGCGHGQFPPRPVCSQCTGREFSSRTVHWARIEEVVSVGDPVIRLATLRTGDGIVLIGRLHGDSDTSTPLSDQPDIPGTAYVPAPGRAGRDESDR